MSAVPNIFEGNRLSLRDSFFYPAQAFLVLIFYLRWCRMLYFLEYLADIVKFLLLLAALEVVFEVAGLFFYFIFIHTCVGLVFYEDCVA